jgi:hypothetical protein
MNITSIAPSIVVVLCTLCPPGEYMVRECTKTSSTVCWPCEAGYACVNGSRTACRLGYEWSGIGITKCEKCSAVCERGWMLVKECNDGVSDKVCAKCPSGFGCSNNGMEMCEPGTYSHSGTCHPCGENQTTREAGAQSADECMCLFTDEEGNCTSGCAEGQIAVGGECRYCPSGYECDSITGRLTKCEIDTYSSKLGKCIPCVQDSYSNAGAGSSEECICDAGFVKDAQLCVPCKPGTVYMSEKCEPCPPGQYCLGRLHHDPCPEDMFSHLGSAICSTCRMNSGCAKPCTDQANCSCDDGFVDHGGECRRCPAATMKPGKLPVDEKGSGCIPCPKGMECLGGPDVRSCDLATFSTGNRSRCSKCSSCSDVTVARCNATHDSVCESAQYALAVITLTQYYRTIASGETFAMFALVLASSIPKSQLVRVCGSEDRASCVECFQGQCPMSKMKRLMPGSGHNYELEIEIRPNAIRLSTNVESLTQSTYLPELAKTTMLKLTDLPFTLRTRVEHRILCPNESEWNGGECVAPVSTYASRTWLGAGLSVVGLALGLAYGSRKRRGGDSNNEKVRWEKVGEITENE